MPRKVAKTEKPALLFVERPVRGAKLQNVPDVRAALNPKEFFTETQIHHGSTLNSWVQPQFDCSLAAAPPVRRGRRKCQSATSVLDRCTQLTRKNNVCKFPTLSFQAGARDRSHKLRSTSTKRWKECTGSPRAGNQPLGSCQSKRTDFSGHCSGAPKRQFGETIPERNAAHVKCSDRAGIQSTDGHRTPAEGASTPGSVEFNTTGAGTVNPPPDVDTPEIMQGGGSCPSSPSVHFLLAQPCTPPCDRPDVLVNDTPERDYGVKVTWRRRKNFMLVLKERGHLSESDALIQN
ncbi:RAD9, HUS1, RAD1-interacting nuclear orphan protein 1 [Kryptolebias marmoratus]|uniref:RAD9-HUS1-RAD1 interacting nuclear orphan 1 n=1 Tax=Kryptolebias marmoratus TaxID=37003 RepID=A0A3Q3AGC2_KRYMA|nr:RAD9, HUS1, RAD1-interacting nuclear orphan protein 1 [Kryptolebias marmoratus]